MRVSITVDSATTDQFRELVRAATRAGADMASVRLNGPSCWRGTTTPLSPNQFAMIVGQLVRFEGTPIADLLPLHDYNDFTVAARDAERIPS